MYKDFQDMESLISENRVNLCLIMVLDICHVPLTIGLETEWF